MGLFEIVLHPHIETNLRDNARTPPPSNSVLVLVEGKALAS